MSTITFANPTYFWALLLLLPILAWYIWKHKRQYAHITVASNRPYGRFLKSNNYVQHLLFVLLLAAYSFLVVAMARPQATLSWEKSKTEGIDIVIAFDISYSMMARDFQPNRLEAAKDVAMEFISNRKNDRIGLVVFSGESFTQCPLTTDHAVLLNLFQKLENNEAIEGGTAIGNGLATSINRLRTSTAKSKVVILLTDGENNRGSIAPETAAELASKFGIKVYTIGIGSNGMASMPMMDMKGRIVYQNTEVRIDEELLKQIASSTGGNYYRAVSKTKLKAIYEQIDQLEKTEIQTDKHSKKSELFFYFALAGGILLMLYLLGKLWFFRTTP